MYLKTLNMAVLCVYKLRPRVHWQGEKIAVVLLARGPSKQRCKRIALCSPSVGAPTGWNPRIFTENLAVHRVAYFIQVLELKLLRPESSKINTATNEQQWCSRGGQGVQTDSSNRMIHSMKRLCATKKS